MKIFLIINANKHSLDFGMKRNKIIVSCLFAPYYTYIGSWTSVFGIVLNNIWFLQ